MQNNGSKASNFKLKPFFSWSDCQLVIRRINPNNQFQQSYENLQAEVQLQSEQITQPFQPIILFQQQFLYQQSQGFYWKKGFALPKFVVKLQQQYYQLLKNDEQITRIYCDLTLAYPTRKDSSFYLQQVRAQGQKLKEFNQKGQVEYQQIKVKKQIEKIYKNQFSILITICASSMQQNKIILKSLISSVFSIQCKRIISRFKKKTQRICVMKLVSPKAFKRPLNNQISKISQNQSQSLQNILEQIRNCNILAKRLLTKHPFYMAYHFRNIFKVYFNSRILQNINGLLNLNTNSIKKKQINITPDFDITKTPILSYSLKKTKKIEKTVKREDSFFNHQFSIQIKKQRYFIEAIIFQPPQSQQYDKKLLLITFQNQILQTLQKNQNKQQYKQILEQIHTQINKFKRTFTYWTKKLFLKFDFMKSQGICSCWRKIKPNTLFKIYRNHYKNIKNILTNI